MSISCYKNLLTILKGMLHNILVRNYQISMWDGHAILLFIRDLVYYIHISAFFFRKKLLIIIIYIYITYTLPHGRLQLQPHITAACDTKNNVLLLLCYVRAFKKNKNPFCDRLYGGTHLNIYL